MKNKLFVVVIFLLGYLSVYAQSKGINFQSIVVDASGAIEVSGYASSDGSSSYNQVLSEKRAQSVAEYLKNKGVKESQIQTIGLGETQPIESNSNEMGRAKNRRIEIKISN